MTRFHKGSIVVSPHTSQPWCPLRATEVCDLASGGQMIRVAVLAKLGWMHASGFLPAPAGTFDARTGRWIAGGGVDVTPKMADLNVEGE